MDLKGKGIESVSEKLGIAPRKVERTLELLESGGTIPFIARYRKEMTGSLDEVAVAAIRDAFADFEELEKRKNAIVSSLQERNLLDDDLKGRIEKAGSLAVLEDIYLPLRPKRKTRASIARERGLETVADVMLKGGDAQKAASQYLSSAISKEAGVESLEDAISGACDIVAEIVSEDSENRSLLRALFKKESTVSSKVVEKTKDQAEKFRDYFDWQEPVSKIAGHRLLAIFRGEAQKFLRVSVEPQKEAALRILQSRYPVKGGKNSQLMATLEDSYQRLIAPSLESELRKELKDAADSEAISVFALNLRELLLAPPMGQKRVLALDPGYRTGAKLVCLSGQGDLLHNETIYPVTDEKGAKSAEKRVKDLVTGLKIEAIAIGNGTAGRETESFVRSLGLDSSIIITLVNEDGASVYSASESARKEFPDHDITVRGAVSIGRRVQDPLAELVKIDPKSIGVGQYQHDVNQSALKKGLEEVVTSCVNRVGVEVNSASAELLEHVAGLGPALASNIIAYRQEKGAFRSRKEFLQVPRLGAKAFEQCAGFLRVRNSDNPLDNTAVHPERYGLVKKMAADLGVKVDDLISSASTRKRINLGDYHAENLGDETLSDIMDELASPGRDPREKFEIFRFDDTVHSIEDLREGMILPAIITNITKFGAFADIGIKQDGLIHISQLSEGFVKDPSDVVHVRQQVRVKVVGIDAGRKRIALTLRI